MSYVTICRFDKISIKFPIQLLGEIDKLILKFIWKSNMMKIAKKFFKKKQNVGGLLSDIYVLCIYNK